MDVSGLKPREQWTTEECNRVTDRLKKAREFSGLSRGQVAEMLRKRGLVRDGASLTVMAADLEDMEGRVYLPTDALLAALCDLYDVDPAALLDPDPLGSARATELGQAILASGIADEDKAKLLELVGLLRQKGPAPAPREG